MRSEKKSAYLLDGGGIIKAGSIPIYTTSAVAAYMKLLLAYNQEEMPVKEVMGKDLFFEEVKFS